MAPIVVNGVETENAVRLCFMPARESEPCQACAWSDDGTYFAWNHDWCKITIFEQNCIDSVRQGQGVLNDDRLTISVGSSVNSMAFCRITSPTVKQHPSTSARYRRIVTHDVVIMTGHSNGRIRAWDVKTGVLKLELCDHVATISSLSFAPHPSVLLVSASMDGTLKLWDMSDDGNMIKTLRTNCTAFYGCCWSPDAMALATVGNYHSVHIWDVKTWSVRHRLTGHRNNVSCCDFSPDGALLATSSYDSRVIIWDTDSGAALLFLEHCTPPLSLIFAGGANGSYVRSVSFCHDGRHVATACDDGYVRFWDAFGQDSCVVQASAIAGGLVCSYSPDGAILAVGTSSGDLSLLLSPMRLASLQQLCRIAIRRLLSRDKVEHLLCMPPPIRRYLQYDRQPVSACG